MWCCLCFIFNRNYLNVISILCVVYMVCMIFVYCLIMCLLCCIFVNKNMFVLGLQVDMIFVVFIVFTVCLFISHTIYSLGCITSCYSIIIIAVSNQANLAISDSNCVRILILGYVTYINIQHQRVANMLHLLRRVVSKGWETAPKITIFS